MLRVILALVTVGVTIYAIVDCLRSTDDEVRILAKPLWFLVTLVPLVGGLAWIAFGRAPAGPFPPHTPRVLAPDDDPEFLRSLDHRFGQRRRPSPPADDGHAPGAGGATPSNGSTQPNGSTQANGPDGEDRPPVT